MDEGCMEDELIAALIATEAGIADIWGTDHELIADHILTGALDSVEAAMEEDKPVSEVNLFI